MSSADEQIAVLKARIENAQRVRARAEADQEAAQAAADTALGKLKSEYNVSTVDEAKALLAEMQDSLGSLVAKTRQHLDSLNL